MKIRFCETPVNIRDEATADCIDRGTLRTTDLHMRGGETVDQYTSRAESNSESGDSTMN
jgi:hypothetical protein